MVIRQRRVGESIMIEEAIIALIIGMLIGFIREWNKKVYFAGFVLLLLCILMSWIFIPGHNDLNIWQLGLNVIALSIGQFAGVELYRDTFDKN